MKSYVFYCSATNCGLEFGMVETVIEVNRSFLKLVLKMLAQDGMVDPISRYNLYSVVKLPPFMTRLECSDFWVESL